MQQKELISPLYKLVVQINKTNDLIEKWSKVTKYSQKTKNNGEQCRQEKIGHWNNLSEPLFIKIAYRLDETKTF